MRRDDRVRVLHMIEAAETALMFAEGRHRPELDADRMLLFALVRAIEMIGEAAAKVSEEGRAVSRSVPWTLVVSMRNRLVHAYFDIDRDIVWRTVTEELPSLIASLRGLIEES